MWPYCITQCSFALFPYIPIFLSVRQHLGNLRIQNRLYLHILVLEQPALVEGVLKIQPCFPWASQKAFSFSGKYPINLCPQSKILWVTLKASPSYPETRCVFSSTLPHKISSSAPESKPAQAWPRPADLDGVEIPELNGKICPKNGKKKKIGFNIYFHPGEILLGRSPSSPGCAAGQELHSPGFYADVGATSPLAWMSPEGLE